VIERVWRHDFGPGSTAGGAACDLQEIGFEVRTDRLLNVVANTVNTR
jgi:hypothetical protein